MTIPRSRRGEPLVALSAVLAMWVGARTVLWDAHPAAAPRLDPAGTHNETFAARQTAGRAPPQQSKVKGPTPPAPLAMSLRVGATPLAPRAELPRPAFRPLRPVVVPAPAPSAIPVAVAAAHQTMWMAALARVPVPPDLLAALRSPAAAPYPPVVRAPNGSSRWSADAWLLLRRDREPASHLPGAGQASYGASQAGAVLRYRLAPGSAHRPAVHLRATSALGGLREHEAALGLSARVVPAIPVVAAAELRASVVRDRTQLRPAVFAVTEIAPVDLPGGIRAEAYAQAGYVGGAFATAFVDGQLRVDRRATRIGHLEVRAGAGAWGGAQKGAARLDVGPTASVALVQSPSARLAVDWRFRIAGDAAPASGPALTLSAGF